MPLALTPPQTLVGVRQMGRRERAWACWLTLQARCPIDSGVWFYDAESNIVVVSVEGHLDTWSFVRTDTNVTLLAIEEKYGAEMRKRAEDAIL